MPDFTVKIHPIRFWLGIRPTPAGELTALPRSLAEFRGRGGEEKDLGRGSGTGKGRDMGEFYNCIV